jgi:hypothetical protein
VVLITSQYCDACPAIEAGLTAHNATLEAHARLYQMELAELSSGFVDRYGIAGVPTFLVFLERHLADGNVVFDPSAEFLQHVLWRNGLAAEGPAFLTDLRNSAGEVTIPEAAALVATNLEGVDFSGRNLRRVTFSGCLMAGANLSNTMLHGAVFSRCDLRGANLEAADLTETTWVETICPDGTLSEDQGRTCVGH